jgi:hypothetical protein
VKQGEDWLEAAGAETHDLRATAIVLCVLQIGGYLMPAEVSRVLGDDVRTDAGTVRMYRGMIDILGNTLISSSLRAEMHAALDAITTKEA